MGLVCSSFDDDGAHSELGILDVSLDEHHRHAHRRPDGLEARRQGTGIVFGHEGRRRLRHGIGHLDPPTSLLGLHRPGLDELPGDGDQRDAEHGNDHDARHQGTLRRHFESRGHGQNRSSRAHDDGVQPDGPRSNAVRQHGEHEDEVGDDEADGSGGNRGHDERNAGEGDVRNQRRTDRAAVGVEGDRRIGGCDTTEHRNDGHRRPREDDAGDDAERDRREAPEASQLMPPTHDRRGRRVVLLLGVDLRARERGRHSVLFTRLI